MKRIEGYFPWCNKLFFNFTLFQTSAIHTARVWFLTITKIHLFLVDLSCDVCGVVSCKFVFSFGAWNDDSVEGESKLRLTLDIPQDKFQRLLKEKDRRKRLFCSWWLLGADWMAFANCFWSVLAKCLFKFPFVVIGSAVMLLFAVRTFVPRSFLVKLVN